MFNTIQNALEVSPPNETVTVDVRLNSDKLLIAVADRGPGIDDEIRDQIFEPFFTTKSGSANSGLGLGLAVCKSEVDAMGGSISFSNRTGGGTIFEIILPIRQSTEKANV